MGDGSNRFKSYKKRWLVMLDLAWINLSISTIWLGFSPVAYKASNYYQTSVATINWLSIGVLVVSVVFGFLWSWLMNKIGLKTCMLLSAWLAAVGSILRICSTVEELPHSLKLTCLFVGQYLVGTVQPLGIYCSPKMAAIWFPSHQRSLASTIGTIANPVGVVVTGAISPLFVSHDGILSTRNMLISYAGLTVFGALITTIIMTSSEPPTLPSLGGTMTLSTNYVKDVKTVLQNKDFIVLMISVGAGIGLYSSFATLGEQVLCPWGYSDTIAGACSSTMTSAGLIGAVISSIIVDRTKCFAESLKFMFVSAALATILFAATHKIYVGSLICIELSILGLMAFGIAPIGMEAGAEITFPVGVSIGTAMIQIMGQILSTVLILLLQSIGRPMSEEELLHSGSKCHTNTNYTTWNETAPTPSPPSTITYDMTVSTYVIAAFITVVASTFLFLFRPTYKRMNAENEADKTSDLTKDKKQADRPTYFG